MTCKSCADRQARFAEWFLTLIRRRKNPDHPTPEELAEESLEVQRRDAIA
jgi:hypothetical protein